MGEARKAAEKGLEASRIGFNRGMDERYCERTRRNDDHWMGNSPPLSGLSGSHFDPAEQSMTCVTADVWPLQEELGLNQPVGRLDISLSSTDAISTTFTPIDSGMFTAELATGYPVAMAQAGGAWFGLRGQTTELPSDIVVSDSVAPNMMGWTDTNT